MPTNPADAAASARREKRSAQRAVSFEIQPEFLRMVTYGMFWFMVGCAMLFHRFLVLPKGAESCTAGETCLFPVDMEDTPLTRAFGYNNVCINWDYSPSRELTAMIYPFVEYPLIAYVVVDHIQIYRDHLEKELPSWFFKLSTFLLPIKILLLSQFRMIFVNEAFRSTVNHTLPFQGLQIALILVALTNALSWTTHKTPLYAKELGLKGTHRLMSLYMLCLIVVSVFKIVVVSSIFAEAPVLDVTKPNSAAVCAFADRAWLVLAALIPPFLAAYERRCEVPLTISIGGGSAAGRPLL